MNISAFSASVLVRSSPSVSALERDAAAVGVWENELTGRTHPRLQILTLAEFFLNMLPDIPWVDVIAVKSAKRADTSQQGNLF